jgi:hypothetical protein
VLTLKKVGDINVCEVNNILVANVVIYFMLTWSSSQDGLANLFMKLVMHVNVFGMQSLYVLYFLVIS